METPVMKYVQQYLLKKNLTKNQDKEAFVKELYELWFGLYKRKVANDSSGFEHVFLGEIKDGIEVTGCHNWLQIYLEEKANRFNYKGYIKPRRRGPGVSDPYETDQLITIQFEWKGASKNVSSSFIGSSPEFEIALYTLCFYCNQTADEIAVALGQYNAKITTYKFPPNPRPGKLYIVSYL